MGWFVTPQRILKPARIRIAFLCVAIVAFVITELGRFVYRPYVRAHGTNDYGLTGSIGNLGGIVVQIFFGLTVVNATKKQSYLLAVFFSLGYVLYEFAQLILPKGVFDWNDIYGTAIGMGLSLMLLLILWRLFPEVESTPNLN
jgi:hypothetical protein